MIPLLDLAHGPLRPVTVSRRVVITSVPGDGEKPRESGGSSWLVLPWEELEALRGTDACKGVELIHHLMLLDAVSLATPHTLRLVGVFFAGQRTCVLHVFPTQLPSGVGCGERPPHSSEFAWRRHSKESSLVNRVLQTQQQPPDFY